MTPIIKIESKTYQIQDEGPTFTIPFAKIGTERHLMFLSI